MRRFKKKALLFMPMRLILTRHGETEENVLGILQGHMHGKLTENGKMQARKLADRLKEEKIDAIYTSDLARAADTAEAISMHHDVPIFHVQELRERDHGSFTGKHKELLDREHPPADSETAEAMALRVRQLLDRAYHEFPHGTVVFVGHSGINRVLINLILKNPPDQWLAVEKSSNAAVTILEIDEDSHHKIHVMNDTGHLDYPSLEQCYGWYEEQGTPENIMRHVKKVREVAVYLAERLKEAGEDIDVLAVDRGALLHDIDKWACLNDDQLEHGAVAEEILTDKGYPYLGFLARQHRSDLNLDGYGTWEEKIVSYADKRVLQDSVVSLEERYDYVRKRYPDTPPDVRGREMHLMEGIEREIFSRLKMDADSLADHAAK
jgi:putative nucleotidyltransferase with HDIG domain